MKTHVTFFVLISIAFVFVNPLQGQTVSTFLTGGGLNGPDGFALDSAENLFVANWGDGSGHTILKITPDTLISVVDSTSDAPDGLVFDASGNLYISDYNSGKIYRMSPSGVKTQFASGLIKPSALVFDDAGNLYVSNFGSTTVSKITPGGIVSTFASGFSGPLGLVFDPAGNLYVSNYYTGKIFKVLPDGTSTVFATVPNGFNSKIQYLVRGPSGNLYLPAYGHHKIYRISPAGEVSVFSGTGVPGSTNGPIGTALFNGPNSIALTAQGDLYVSEYNANRIRKITGVEFPAGLNYNKSDPQLIPCSLKIYPNPFSSSTNITMAPATQGDMTICIRDVFGKTIYQTRSCNTLSGICNLVVDGNLMDAGIYFCSLIRENTTICCHKMVCIK
jgi:sugar lactone lactonase YvrE